MRHFRFPQPRSVIFKRQVLPVVVHANLPQPIRIRERLQALELILTQRRLQLISDFDECHARHYTSPSSLTAIPVFLSSRNLEPPSFRSKGEVYTERYRQTIRSN